MNPFDQQQIKFQQSESDEESREAGATLFRFSTGFFLLALLYVGSYVGLRYGHVIVAYHDRVMVSPGTTVPLDAYQPLMRAEQMCNKFSHSGL